MKSVDQLPDWAKVAAAKWALMGLRPGTPIVVTAGRYKGRRGSVRGFDPEHGYRVSLNSVGSKSLSSGSVQEAFKK